MTYLYLYGLDTGFDIEPEHKFIAHSFLLALRDLLLKKEENGVHLTSEDLKNTYDFIFSNESILYFLFNAAGWDIDNWRKIAIIILNDDVKANEFLNSNLLLNLVNFR